MSNNFCSIFFSFRFALPGFSVTFQLHKVLKLMWQKLYNYTTK